VNALAVQETNPQSRVVRDVARALDRGGVECLHGYAEEADDTDLDFTVGPDSFAVVELVPNGAFGWLGAKLWSARGRQ
jgi:hypothetical protein